MKKLFTMLFLMLFTFSLAGCLPMPDPTSEDINETFLIGERLAKNQPTPTDINYSLERLNLIARTYWVNGQRDKAITVLNASPIPLPLGYITLFSGPTVVAQFTVMGKISSLNSWLTPDEYYNYVDDDGSSFKVLVEMPDVDGTYGNKTNGVFFFTTDGKYIEWTGEYLYSDMFLRIDDPIITVGGE